jgi:ring-1,2-phenylacetyl-CoA epoxidase subunit PaaC
MDRQQALFEFLLRMGDNTLILGHRLSAWCGHAPMLEEDIATANIALDLIGQTQLWLGLAGEIEDQCRSADDLAYLRDVMDFHNFLLVERPNGDYGQTLMRQFLFDAWHKPMLAELSKSDDARISAIAQKSFKEATYHLERTGDLVVRLGDGTAESHKRMQTALDTLWPYTGEMFQADHIDDALAGTVADLSIVHHEFSQTLQTVFSAASMKHPTDAFAHKGGKTGRHSEHLGHLLAEMQFLQRAYPGATW